MVAEQSKFLYKFFEIDDSRFFHTVHASVDFELDAVARFNCELVFFHDLVGDKCVVYA